MVSDVLAKLNSTANCTMARSANLWLTLTLSLGAGSASAIGNQEKLLTRQESVEVLQQEALLIVRAM
jgi:hypothetical protein